jgi:hypothetical protein
VGFVVDKVTLERVFFRTVYFGGVDGRIILKWLFTKWDGEHGLD